MYKESEEAQRDLGLSHYIRKKDICPKIWQSL
jgi:hypothetical protein